MSLSARQAEIAGDSVDRRGWFRAFQDVSREHGFEPLRVEGTIPRELRGALYRNGPGLVQLFGRRYEHWFDGDGLVSALRIEADGRALGAVRLLDTPGLVEERRRGKPYFASYGTAAPGLPDPVRIWRAAMGRGKNPANTSVLAWDERLFALCEIGKPLEIDPDTLAAIGESDLDGAVARAFNAHPRRVDASGNVYNIGVARGLPNAVDCVILRPDGTTGRIARFPLPFATLIHDFAATERHIVILVAPVELRIISTLLERRSFAENLKWVPETGSEVIVVPLDAPASPVRFHVDPFWAWHVANAFERSGEIVLDVVRYDDFVSSNEWLANLTHGDPGADADGVLTRLTIDVGRKALRRETLRDRTGEFPRIAPRAAARPHRYVYLAEHSTRAAGRAGPQDTLVRVDCERGTVDEHRFGPGQYPSEGVLVPRPGGRDEDDGWLVTQVYDARSHTSHWAIFDARRLNDGPVALAHLDHHVPLSFHGTWRPARPGL